MKKFFFKYVLTTIVAVLAIVGTYSYAGEKNQKQKYSMQEYKVQDIGIKKSDAIRFCIVNYDTIDPITSKNQNVQDLTKLIFEPLLSLDENYQIQSCLAKEWAKVNDTQYLIKLKEHITWHNGKKFTAQDVKYTIDKIKEKDTSVYQSNVEHIRDVIVIDDSMLKIVLEEQVPFFEYQLTFPIISSQDYDHTKLIGTGKYQIKEESTQMILLGEYTNWWKTDETDTIIKKVEIYLYDSISTAYQKFMEGQIDLLTTSNLNVEHYIGSMGFNSKQFPDRQYDFIACNMNHPILAQKEVRQAISYAINKKEIVKNIYQDKYQIVNSPLDGSKYLKGDWEQDNYQPAEAKKLLKKAGWQEENGYWKIKQNGKEMKLQLSLTVCEENEQRVQVAEMIKNQLEQIGMRVNLNLISLKNYNQCIQNKEYELLLAGMLTAISPDLTSYLGEENMANFQNDELKSLLLDVQNIAEESIRKQKYRRIQEMIQEEMPYIGLYFQTKTVLYQKNLMGNIQPTAYCIFYHMNTWYRQD